MKYSILGYNQEKVLELEKTLKIEDKEKHLAIDVTDLLILNDIADFMNRKNIIKYTINDKTYTCVKYTTIIEDLPILRIKQQALSDRLWKLCVFGLLEKEVIKNQVGSFTAFRIGDKYETLIYGGKDEIGTSSVLLSHKYSTTSASVVDYKCNILNNNIYNINPSTINPILKEENTNVFPKKKALNYQEIVDCWNEYNGKRCGKVTRLTDKRKHAIKKILVEHEITQEELMRLFKTFPYADSWLYNPTKEHKNWKPDFDWWMANTNGWFTKALEGKVHTQNTIVFNEIMQNGLESVYAPACDGALSWNDYYKCFMYVGFWDGKHIPDGYNDDNRPNGASVTLNNGRGVLVWNSETKEWEKK